MARVDNNFAANNEITFKTFTITITGTNDGPVFTSGSQRVSFVGGKNTPGGPLTTNDATSGTLSFADADLSDTHTVSTKLASATLAGADISQLAPGPRKIFETALSASIAAGNDSTLKGTGTINWKLADLPVYLADFIPAGQTLTLIYTVTVKDSQNTTSSQNLTVTITGNDTPAVVWIATTDPGSPSGELWSDATNWGTGTVPTGDDDAIIITDQLRGLTPSYPVTVTSAATAKSLEMNNYGTLFTNSPTLINNSTLTIGAGGISLAADSIIRNNGTISVAGLMEVLNQSTLENSGLIHLATGGDFKDQSVITNSGTFELDGGTLNVEVDIANAGGNLAFSGGARMTLAGGSISGGAITGNAQIDITGDSSLNDIAVSNFWLTVDAAKTLTLNGATITGGIVENDGTIHVTGDSTINDSGLGNHQLTIDSNKTLTLDNIGVSGGTITNNGAIKVDAFKLLALQGVALSGGTINNAGTVAITASSSIENAIFNNALLTVQGNQTLTLSGTEVTGGVINNLSGVVGGIIHVTGNSAINGAALNNGQLTIDATKTLTLDGTTVTGTTITDNGTIRVDAARTLSLNGVTLTGGAITNLGTIDITGDSSIINDALSNTRLTVDATRTLTISGTTITGGTVTDRGTIRVTGDSAINGAALNNGQLTIDAAKILTLNDATVTGTTITDNGTIKVDAAKTLNLSGVVLTGGAITNLGTINVTGDSSIINDALTNTHLTVDATKTLTISGTTITGGTITDSGLIHVTGDSAINGAALNNGQLTVDAAKTLTLDGTTVTGSNITNTGATLSVSAARTMTLDDVTVNGGSITGNGTVHVDATRTLTLNGVTVTSGALTNDGTIETAAATALNGVGIANAGTIEATSGVLKISGSVQGSGSIQIDAGASLELDATVAATQRIVFDGAGSSEFQLDASTFGGQIQGMAATDEIDLRTIGYGLSTTGTYVSNANNDGGVLTITDGTHSISMTLVGDYRHAHFAGASDGHGGTLITLNAADSGPTFAAGETTQTGAFAELSDSTGASTSNPMPALTGSVHFTDIDLVDRPTATITSQTVTWTDHATNLSASLTEAQIDAFEHALLLQQSGNANNGAIAWTYTISDDALDFLAAGQTATVTSTITLDDHEGGKDTASVRITVTGANDGPVAVADTDIGHIVEAGNDGNEVLGGVSTTTGSVLANDTDADFTDTHQVIGVTNGTVSGVLTSGVGTVIAGTYGSLLLNDDGTWTYTLDNANPLTNALVEGEHASDIFSYTEADNHGATSTTTLTIDVTGANDAPTLAPANAGPLTDTAGNTGFDILTGSLVGYDADNGEAALLTYSALGAPAGSAIAGTYGSLTVNADGTYTYVPDAVAINALHDGPVTDVFTVQTHRRAWRHRHRDVHGQCDRRQRRAGAGCGDQEPLGYRR